MKKMVIIKKKNKSISDIYKKMSHIEHVLKKPDSYIGSIEKENTKLSILNNGDNSNVKIINKEFQFCPGFYKCFDELLVNAYDHSKRQTEKWKNNKKIKRVTYIKVHIDVKNNIISIENDGDGIDIEILPEHNIYPPELIFGTLLTSTNYDDNDKRIWGGKNGYGAKLANIFSELMTVETVDSKRNKKYVQTFKNNMSIKNKPIITIDLSNKSYTKITWKPDLKRFNIEELDNGHVSLMKKRVYDIAACTDNITVYLNDNKVNIKGFDNYIDYFIDKNKARIYQKGNGWNVVACANDDDTFEQHSWVNGVNTIRGGKHVDYIVEQIKDKLGVLIKKRKKIDVKPAYIKTQLKVFVNATVVNPTFDGQTKETLKTNKSKFEYYLELEDKFIEKLYKTEITDKILAQNNYKQNKSLSKTDGRKRNYVKVEKYSGAIWAGTTRSQLCTLILTEGDSAKSMAIAGLSEVGRQKYGVFPLKGKLLNVRDASPSDIFKNKEITNLKQIIGLQSGKKYNLNDKKWPLRYGKILIMTDQDLDGSHIKGLVMNLFDNRWPDLLNGNFISSMVTPIIKVSKKKNTKSFYSIQEYDKWKLNKSSKGFKIKYYKGLGTSTNKEAREYFRNLKIISYFKELNKPNRLDLAFKKTRADDRKDWLFKYNRDEIVNFNDNKMSFNEFVDKELIHFSNYSTCRSIPDIRDGLKPSTRKILFSCFKKNLNKEIK